MAVANLALPQGLLKLIHIMTTKKYPNKIYFLTNLHGPSPQPKMKIALYEELVIISAPNKSNTTVVSIKGLLPYYFYSTLSIVVSYFLVKTEQTR
jgi:hypothetical protein